MRKILLIFCLYIATISGFAQVVKFTTPLKQVPDLIIQNRFIKANEMLQQEALANPDNRAVDYFQAATWAMELFVESDDESFTHGLEKIEDRLSRIEDLPKTEPWRNVFLGELRVALAILHAKFKNNLKGFWQFNQAYGLLEDNQEAFPNFPHNNLSFGVLQATLGSLPEEYQSIASLIGLSGDLDKGMNMLKNAYWRTTANEDTKFLRNYYGFIYSFVNFQLFSSQEVSPKSLGLSFGKDGFLIYLQALMNYADGKGKEAVELLQNRKLSQNEKPFYYLDYLLGKYALAYKPDLAKASLLKFLSRANNLPYKKSAYRYLCWYYILTENPVEVERYRSKILNEGNTALGADKQAFLEAKQGFNFTLVKGRLYFDAAMYDKALEVLNEKPVKQCCPSENEKVELYYRKGRVYQKLDKTLEAIKAFENAISFNNAESSYAMANGYLQLGTLYKEVGEKQKAKAALNKVGKLKGFPFYESLHQKAKALLSSLE